MAADFIGMTELRSGAPVYLFEEIKEVSRSRYFKKAILSTLVTGGLGVLFSAHLRKMWSRFWTGKVVRRITRIDHLRIDLREVVGEIENPNRTRLEVEIRINKRLEKVVANAAVIEEKVKALVEFYKAVPDDYRISLVEKQIMVDRRARKRF